MAPHQTEQPAILSALGIEALPSFEEMLVEQPTS